MYAQFLTHADFQLFKPHQLARKLNSKMQPIIWVCTNQPKTFIVTNEWILYKSWNNLQILIQGTY